MNNKENKTNIILDILIYSISAGIIAYIVYSLVILKNDLNYLHVILIVVSAGLLLFKKADKLKILNILEFNSKLDNLKKENKKEFDEIKSQIQNVTMNYMPRQSLTNIITADRSLPEMMKESRSKATEILDAGEKRTEEDKGTNDIVRLRQRVRTIYERSYDFLFLTRALQIAILENRMFEPKDLAIGIGIKSFEERTTFLLKQILDNDLRKMLPTVVVDDKEGVKEAFQIDKLVKDLELIEDVVEIRSKLKKDSLPESKIEEANKKLDIVHDALFDLEILIMYRCNFALLYENKMRSGIKALQDEIRAANKEDREIRLPPK